MRRPIPHQLLRVTLAVAISSCGCAAKLSQPGTDLADYQAMALRMEYPIEADCEPVDHLDEPPPLTIHDYEALEYWDLTLEEAIQQALATSKVVRDLGGRVLHAPDHVATVFEPSLIETDPRFGVEAALSAFDAQWESGVFFENNDRALNNQFLGGGTRLLKQDLGNFETSLSKRAATGGEYRLRHAWDYDANNAPGNAFPSAWTVMLDAEVRHPLLRGQGREFNRVYGPNGAPGLARGVLVARMNTDVSLAEFRAAVRQLVSDIENTYWELQYAYRELDAKVRARDRAQKTWQVIADWRERSRVGGEADKEAAAREQYYRLQAEVQLALTGAALEDTRTTSFRGQGGVQAQERRLRLLIGAPINDGRLIRPVDDPSMAKIEFQWGEIVATAMEANPDLVAQRWKVKRAESVLQASRNLTLPALDVVGRYRWRGFGHDLLRSGRNGAPQFDDAYGDLTTGDFQEWQLGMEMALPVGNRQGHAAYRNAMLGVARQRAVLDEQRRTVVHHLSAARADMEGAYERARTQFNRVVAARDQLLALETLAADPEPNQLARLIDQLLVAQRTLADAEARFFREAATYAVSLKNVHYYQGTLLGYNGVHLAEGEWPAKAYHDAAEKHLRSKPRKPVRSGEVVSAGPATEIEAVETVTLESEPAGEEDRP